MTQIPGGFYLPLIFQGAAPPTMSTSTALTASTHKIAWCGYVSFVGTGSKNLSRVQFSFGSITKAGGSALTVSIQDIDTTTGQPMRPDGTQDQTVAIANADSGLATSSWYRTSTLSASRSVSNGSLIAVVLEYDGAGRLGSDSISVRGLAISNNAIPSQSSQETLMHYNGAAWSQSALANNILLEFDDGTFGLLDPVDHVPCSAAVTSYAYNINTGTRDEAGFEYIPPFTHDIDSVWFCVAAGASADYDFVIYEGTTAVLTKSVDATQTNATTGKHQVIPIAQTTLTAGTTYRFILKATTTNNITIYSMSVNANSHLDVLSGGDNFMFTSRVDAGSFSTASTTERVAGGIKICTVPTAGGGGLLTHPGMTGGMRG